MAVHIDEVHTELAVLQSDALLSPEVLCRIVDAVVARLDARSRESSARASELDMRSVVEQQRIARGGHHG